MRLSVRAKPGSRTESVTALREENGALQLVVRVRAPAREGAANTAVAKAVAKAVARVLGLRPRQVQLVRGRTGRMKLLDVDAPDEVVLAALGELAEEAADS